MTKWQPIKTAPKDRPILVYGDKERGNLAEFSQRICVAKFDHDMDLLSGVVPLFVYAEGYDNQSNRCITPSHWMPLPEPPK